jgi:copper chaperone CopZ
MKFSSTYLHVIGGRLRIKIPHVKNSLSAANTIERFLENMDGVKSVKANPATGNVLVHFDAEAVRHHEIVEALGKQGHLEQLKVLQGPRRVTTGDQLFSSASTNLVADIVLQRVLELAVKRALLAFL